jgi:ketosteroid isomerase-like protein
MSQENVDAHRRAFAAVNRRDFDAFVALADDEVEAIASLTPMEGGYRGHEGMRRWWDDLLNTFPDWTIDVVEVRDLGDVTVAAVRAHGRGAGSDTPVKTSVWQVARWRDDKCVWWASFGTEAGALEAASLLESGS